MGAVCIATSAKTITTNGKSLQSLILNGINGTWTLQDALTTGSNITLTAGTFNTNNQTISAGTFSSTNSNVRSVNLGSSTVTLTQLPQAWQFTNTTNLTFNAGTSTITIPANASFSQTFLGGGLTYNNVIFNSGSVAAFGVSISGNNRFSNLTLNAPSLTGVAQFTFSDNQTVTGTFTAAGATNIRRIGIYSDVIGTQRTFNIATASCANADFRDIAVTGAVGTLTGTSLGDCGGNSGITFDAAKTVYWNLAGSQSWSSTGWATSSGGSPNSANFPLAQDTCVFDNAGAMGSFPSGGVVFDAPWNIATINASARTSTGSLSQGAGTVNNIYGDITFGSGINTVNGTGTWSFAKQGIQTINTNGVNLNSIISVNSGTGTLRLLGNLTHNFSQITTLTSGTLDLNNFTFTTNGIFAIAANALARSIAFGTGAITLTYNVGTLWNIPTLTNFTLTGTPTVNCTAAAVSGTRTILHGRDAGGTEANAISPTSVGSLVLVCSGHFRNINLTGFSGSFANDPRVIYGNLLIPTTTTVTAGGSATTFAGTGATQTLTTSGKTLDFPIVIGGTGNTLKLLDTLTQGTTRAFTINSGCTVDANLQSASVGNLTVIATPNIVNLVSGTLTAQTVTHNAGTLTMSASFKINVTGI
jgi:hypothetical protein